MDTNAQKLSGDNINKHIGDGNENVTNDNRNVKAGPKENANVKTPAGSLPAIEATTPNGINIPNVAAAGK